MTDIITATKIIEQISLIEKAYREEFVSEADLIRYIGNIKNNLQQEVDVIEEMMFEEMNMIDSDGTAFGQVA